VTHSLGRFLIQEASVPAGSAAERLFRVFTAGEKPVSIQYIQYYGGDAGEYLQLFLIPPNVMSAGLKPSDTAGTLAITNYNLLVGAKGTIEAPSTVVFANGALRSDVMIPPYASVAMNMSAANTAAWVITVGGFEIA